MYIRILYLVTINQINGNVSLVPKLTPFYSRSSPSPGLEQFASQFLTQKDFIQNSVLTRTFDIK